MPDTEPQAAPSPAPQAGPVPSYVVNAQGYGFTPGTVLTSVQVEAAQKAGTLSLFTVRTMKGA